MFKTQRVLLEPANNESGGGNETSITSPPANLGVATEMLQGSPATPVHNEQRVPESIKGKVFDIEGEDFGELEKVEKKVETKKEETKVEDIKTEEKKGLKVKYPEEQKKDEAPTKEQLEALAKEKSTGQKDKLPARDFSIFPEEYHKVLNEMSRPAFETFTKTFKELAETKAEKEKVESEYKKIQEGGLPSSWYEHPESWRLHPAAQNSIQRIDKLEAEENFWRQQLENISNGEKFRLLRGWDKTTGQLVAGDEIEPTEQAKTDIFLKLGQYQNAKNSEAIKLNTFAQQFSSQMQAFNKQAEAIIEQEWPWHKDEKHEAQKWVKEFKEVLPLEQREQLGFRVAALLYATYMKTNELLEAERGKQKKEEIIKESSRIAEPSLRSPSVSGGSKKIVGNGSYVPPSTFDLNGL